MSPVIWTSIATGKVPDKHGIHGFIEKMANGYEHIPVTSDMRRVKAIWNILSDFEKKVGIISWWVTRPPGTSQWFYDFGWISHAPFYVSGGYLQGI